MARPWFNRGHESMSFVLQNRVPRVDHRPDPGGLLSGDHPVLVQHCCQVQRAAVTAAAAATVTATTVAATALEEGKQSSDA